MKKILFLIMYYEEPLLKKELDILLPHYLKMKEKHHLDNIEIYAYCGDTTIKRIKVDKKQHLIYVPISEPESNAMTFEKTKKVFKYCYNNFDFDYIYRGNTSTFTNIVLLNEFIQNNAELLNGDSLCGSEVYPKLKFEGDTVTGFRFCYPRGNSVIYNRDIVKYIFNSKINHVNEVNCVADDDAIGAILSQKQTQGKLLSYFQEWIRTYSDTESLFGNTDDSFEHLRKYIAIQVKKYGNRENGEFDELKKLIEKFEKKYIFKQKDLEFVEQALRSKAMFWGFPILWGYLGIKEKNQLFKLGMNKQIVYRYKGLEL